jgi:hypothetical protein
MATLLADVRALWARERALIVALAAPFLFLPTLAVQLLTPPPPGLPAERTQETLARWFDALSVWGEANAGWYLLADAVAVLGAAALTILLADPARPTVGEALARAGQLWPRFLLASVLAAIPVGLGMWLILPGLFLQARFVAATTALAVEPVSAAGALGRSWRLTRSAAGSMFGVVALLFAVQWMALLPLVPLDTWLRSPAHLNPVVLALVEAAMAAIGALYEAALVMLGVVAYRRLAS